MQEKKTASAFKPRDGGLFPQRQKPSAAAERAAKAALLRSRLSVDSPRATSVGRGTFLRGLPSAKALMMIVARWYAAQGCMGGYFFSIDTCRAAMSEAHPMPESCGAGGRLVRAGRAIGAATAPKLRTTALGGHPQAFSSGQPAPADAAGQAAGATEEVLTDLSTSLSGSCMSLCLVLFSGTETE